MLWISHSFFQLALFSNCSLRQERQRWQERLSLYKSKYDDHMGEKQQVVASHLFSNPSPFLHAFSHSLHPLSGPPLLHRALLRRLSPHPLSDPPRLHRLSFDDLILGTEVVIRFNRARIRRTWHCLRFDVRAIAA